MHGRTASQDGALLDVDEPPATFHFSVSRGLEEATNGRKIWSDLGSTSIQLNCLKEMKAHRRRMLHEVCVTLL